MGRIRRHLRSNVVGYIALFFALSTGSAVALSGSNTVFTDDVANDTQPASGGNPAGGLTAPDLRAGSVGTSEVAANSLNGGDINESGLGIVPNADQLDGMDSTAFLDSCPAGTSAFGRICAGSDGTARGWFQAMTYCGGLGLRLSSTSEAVTLAQNHDVPGVVNQEFFWTDNYFSNGQDQAVAVNELGNFNFYPTVSAFHETVCVTDPSN